MTPKDFKKLYENGSAWARRGSMAVIPPLPIFQLLDHHSIMPGYLRKEVWEPYKRKS